jgi:hypothetical protein
MTPDPKARIAELEAENSDAGADAFACLRGYLATMRKHS